MVDTKRILLIDDDPNVIGYLKRLLQVLGHTVDACDNGAEGLKRSSEGEYDMVVSDLNMPGDPSQLDLIRKLRETNPERPLVVVSGYPTQERLQACREVGVTEFLTKPFEVSFIKNVLTQVFEGQTDDAEQAKDVPMSGEA